MWAVVKINQVTQVVHGGAGVLIEDVRHPPSIFRQWTPAQLLEIGVFPYEEESRDQKFYKYRGERLDIRKDRVVKVWDLVTPLPIKDLRSRFSKETDTRALSLLAGTDWYVTRKAETNKAIPKNIVDYREAVRTSWESILELIKGSSNVTELKALWVIPVNKKGEHTGNSPINDWPDNLE